VELAKSRPGWLAATDEALLVAYCATRATYEAAAADVEQRGHLVPGRSPSDRAKGEHALVTNPSVRIARDALVALLKLAQQLGFSPMSRDRVDRGPGATESDHGSRFFSGTDLLS
jgi:P27 family predicted phage terminase small subunit